MVLLLSLSLLLLHEWDEFGELNNNVDGLGALGKMSEMEELAALCNISMNLFHCPGGELDKFAIFHFKKIENVS